MPIKLTADLLGAAGSLLHHVQHVLPFSLALRRRGGAAVRLHRHHRAVLHALVEAAAASRAVPDLARGPWIALVVRAHWEQHIGAGE